MTAYVAVDDQAVVAFIYLLSDADPCYETLLHQRWTGFRLSPRFGE